MVVRLTIITDLPISQNIASYYFLSYPHTTSLHVALSEKKTDGCICVTQTNNIDVS